MTELTFPNIRKIFVPDPSYRIYDADLSGADAQVVAWEAEDEDLKQAFRQGWKIHDKNAEDMWGSEYTKATDATKARLYREIKSGVHGTNYGSSARNLAITFGWTIKKAEDFQRRWFSIHPAIKQWHRRVEHQLDTTMSISNRFGQRIIYFDRPANVFTKALAWVPQSTVGTITFKAAIRLEDEVPEVQLLLQVHDSLVFQMQPQHEHKLPEINAKMSVTVPYDDPLIIPWGLKSSDRSWGHCEKRGWERAQAA